MTDSYRWLDAVTQAEMVRKGDVTPRELVEAAIARAERVNPQLHAILTPLYDKARKAAADPNLPRGPLQGVPFLLKDIMGYSAGDPYHMGMAALRSPDGAARAPTSRRRSGRGSRGDRQDQRPRARYHPVDGAARVRSVAQSLGPTRSPGGSSGGSAAAVAAGIVRSRTATTAAARSASRRASAAWSDSSRRGAGAPWVPISATASAGSRSRAR